MGGYRDGTCNNPCPAGYYVNMLHSFEDIDLALANATPDFDH